MAAGARRGPVAARRQRRTLRLMQVLLVLLAAGLLLFAGYSLGVLRGFSEGRRAEDLDRPRPPSALQAVVLAALGAGALGGAVALGGSEGVRVPTPARLEELTERAQTAAIRRAEEVGGEDR
jgi:hypothetical protein